MLISELLRPGSASTDPEISRFEINDGGVLEQDLAIQLAAGSKEMRPVAIASGKDGRALALFCSFSGLEVELLQVDLTSGMSRSIWIAPSGVSLAEFYRKGPWASSPADRMSGECEPDIIPEASSTLLTMGLLDPSGRQALLCKKIDFSGEAPAEEVLFPIGPKGSCVYFAGTTGNSIGWGLFYAAHASTGQYELRFARISKLTGACVSDILIASGLEFPSWPGFKLGARTIGEAEYFLTSCCLKGVDGVWLFQVKGGD